MGGGPVGIAQKETVVRSNGQRVAGQSHVGEARGKVRTGMFEYGSEAVRHSLAALPAFVPNPDRPEPT